MNLNDFKKFIGEILENPDSIKDIDGMMNKALDMYKELSQMFIHATPVEREKLASELMTMGQFFEAKLDTAADKLGVSKEELLQKMQDPKNYSQDVWSSVQNFQNKIESEKKGFIKTISTDEEDTTMKRKNKSNKTLNKKSWVSA